MGLKCVRCGSKDLRYKDRVKRIIRGRGGAVSWVIIHRYRCLSCGTVFRNLPDNIYRFKHYDFDIITGFLDGLLTVYVRGFEDYPCEKTIQRWRSYYEHLL